MASSKIVAWSIGPGATEMRTCKTSEGGTLEYRVRRSGSLRVFGNCVCVYVLSAYIFIQCWRESPSNGDHDIDGSKVWAHLVQCSKVSKVVWVNWYLCIYLCIHICTPYTLPTRSPYYGQEAHKYFYAGCRATPFHRRGDSSHAT